MMGKIQHVAFGLGKGQKKFWLFARLFVRWLAPKLLCLGKAQKKILAFRSTFRTLADAEVTPSRKSSKKNFGFSLDFS